MEFSRRYKMVSDHPSEQPFKKSTFCLFQTPGQTWNSLCFSTYKMYFDPICTPASQVKFVIITNLFSMLDIEDRSNFYGVTRLKEIIMIER